ncbi:MAG: HAAS signaling domain-containing protein [Lysinibacillus sp.]
MKLIDVYIQEVTRRLPRKMRKDIALELRSTIEDMLPEQYEENDVKEVLNQLGNPVMLANGYKDRPAYLIGPRYYDLYVSLLKIVIPIIAVVVMITTMTQQLTDINGEHSIASAISGMITTVIARTFEVVAQTFFGLTLSFAIIDRFDKRDNEEPVSMSFEKWTADELKNVTYIPAKRDVSKLEVFWRLLWTAIWVTVYFYANRLIGVYEGTENGVQFVMPALNQDVLLSFWPVVIGVAALDVGLSLFKLFEGQWTKRLAIFNGVVEIALTVAFIVVLIAPNLLNDAFITYMNDLLNISNSQWDTWFIGLLIIISIISTIYNIYDGFKKSNALENYNLNSN